MNPLHKMIHGTNPGTSETSTKNEMKNMAAESPRRTANYDPFAEELRDFESAVAIALHRGESEIETSEEVIKFYNPNGLGGAKHFIYKSLMIFPLGKTEAVKEEMNEALSKRLHGAKEGKLIGG